MEALFVLAALLFLAGPIVAIVALVKASNLDTQLRKLRKEVAELRATGVSQTAEPVAEPAAVAETVVAEAKATEESVPDEAMAATAAEPPVAEQSAAWAASADRSPRNMEQALASRWLVWLGGAAIGLGGLLLIKYAHDQGLVPPILRVIMGLAFGGALVAAGEWLRRKRGEEVKDYVPAALSAAGLLIAYGVSYAAYALYNIVAPAVCFPLLAAISLGALWLSLRQGPLIAALGLVGATATPALISTDSPSTSGFFAYLLVILVASLWMLRKRDWWWLGYAAVAVSAGWGLLWITGQGTSPSLPIGLFGLAVGAVATLVPRGRDILLADMGSLWDTKAIKPVMGVAIAGCFAGGAILAALTVQSGHGFAPLLMFAFGMAALAAFGWFRDGLVTAPLLAAGVSLIVMMAWRDVGFHEWAFDEGGFWTTVPGLIEPPRFRNTTLLFMAGFTVVGLLGVLRKVETRPWAILAAGSAVLFTFGTWARADSTWGWHAWALLALALFAVLEFGVWRLLPRLTDVSVARSIEVLVLGGVLLLVFALDRALDGVWLTLAIAALAAAVASATRLISLPNIGGIASVVAGFAAARLFLGREFWGEPTNMPLGAHWVLYGYGVPAVLFWQASRWLNREGFERWRVALEGVSLGLAVSLVSLELRVLIGGSITHPGMTMLEWAAHACAWLGAAYGLAYRQQLYSSFVSMWGARALAVGATFMFFVLLSARNPVISGDAVAGGQVFNALWLAYLAPVPLYALFARKLEGLGWPHLRNAVGVLALLLLMVFVTLIVKRQFQDETLSASFESQAESYAISLAWLVTGIAIFITGLKLDRQTVRYGGLAVIVLTVLKVFGLDLFELGGLWRIASIIGLGACLVGVGWLYTRFIVKKEPHHETSQKA